MSNEKSEQSFEGIFDESPKDPKIEWLKGLLKTVGINRRALGIIRAMNGGDKRRAAEIAIEAKSNGISVDELNVAYRKLKK